MSIPQRRRTRGDRGASAVEYALIVALIAVVIVGSVTLFGGAATGLFSKTCGSMNSSVTSC